MKFTKLIRSVPFLHRRLNYGKTDTRTYSAPAPEVGGAQQKGCVICCYEQNNQLELSTSGAELDQQCGGKISQQLNTYACELHLGKAFAITDILEYSAVAITSIGPKTACYDVIESLDEARENIRWGVGAGVMLLKERGCVAVDVDPCTAPDAAAEAAELAAWRFEMFKSPRCCKPPLQVCQYGGGSQLWIEGSIRGCAQNWARCLSDMPANKMTPVDLAQCALDRLCPLGIQVEAYDREWIEAQGMRAFLAVARGSCDTPMFLELQYSGAGPNLPPVLLAAKGVTFDSGGLCLKECHSMTENRGSMAGAAVVLAAFEIIAKLQLPINVTGVIPICENMVSGQCMKVGDVVQALNGMTIQIENTDMEGRLMMADALVYGQSLFKPSLVIDVATFTHGVLMATGGGAFGCFSNSDAAWRAARAAGAHSGDRPWRFPLWYYFQKQITNDASVDLRNQGSGYATPCLGAAFLKNFICGDWLHMDITGVGKVAHSGAPPYLDTCRMTGRPTRTLAVLLQQIACPPAPQPCLEAPQPCPPAPAPQPCPPAPAPQPCPPVSQPCPPAPAPQPCPPVSQPCPPAPAPEPCPPALPPCPPYPPAPRPCPPCPPAPRPCPPAPAPEPCPPALPPCPPAPAPQPCPPAPAPEPCPPALPPYPPAPRPYPPCPPAPQPCPPAPAPEPCPPALRPCPPYPPAPRLCPPYPPAPQPCPPAPAPQPCPPVSQPCPPGLAPQPCPPAPAPQPCPPAPAPQPCPPAPAPEPCPPALPPCPPYQPAPRPYPPCPPAPRPCPPVPAPRPCPPAPRPCPPYQPAPRPYPPCPPAPRPCPPAPAPEPCPPAPRPCPPAPRPCPPAPRPCPPAPAPRPYPPCPPCPPAPRPCPPAPAPEPCPPAPRPYPPCPPAPRPYPPAPRPCPPTPAPQPCPPTPRPCPPAPAPEPSPLIPAPAPCPPAPRPCPPAPAPEPCPPTPRPYPPCPPAPRPCPPTPAPQPCPPAPRPCPPCPQPCCAPKPQTCPPSTQTCAPNPQTCVPPMKHKCN